MEAGQTAEAEDINDMESVGNTRTSQLAEERDGDVHVEVIISFLD